MAGLPVGMGGPYIRVNNITVQQRVFCDKRKYIKKLEEISINIVQSNIESIRKKNITKTGFRVYENGFIGIAEQWEKWIIQIQKESN